MKERHFYRYSYGCPVHAGGWDEDQRQCSCRREFSVEGHPGAHSQAECASEGGACAPTQDRLAQLVEAVAEAASRTGTSWQPIDEAACQRAKDALEAALDAAGPAGIRSLPEQLQSWLALNGYGRRDEES